MTSASPNWSVKQLAVGARLDIGRVRPNNEDNLCTLLPPDSPVGFGGVLAVADGIGGQRAGEVASQMAVDAVAELIGPDSDLGDRPVTIEVGRLSPDRIERALSSGAELARDMHGRGLIAGALLSLQGRSLSIGDEKCALAPKNDLVSPAWPGLPPTGGIEALV